MDTNGFCVVDTTEIMPCLLLRPYIRCFAYREWDSMDFRIRRPMFATHDFLITFNLTEKKFGYINPPDEEFVEREEVLKSDIVITGIGSRYAGMMTSEGHVRLFSIYFHPTGFYQIFGIPGIHFADRIEEDVYTCNKDLSDLHEQLKTSKDIAEMITRCEFYLLKQWSHSSAKHPYNNLRFVSECIVRGNNNYSIEKMAFDANMSLKTFERRFAELVGTSPKLFSRIVRFNKAIALKMSNPIKTWTTIAHDCGYFDQMHFIKDFKQFSGKAPGIFFKDSPPVSENFKRE